MEQIISDDYMLKNMACYKIKDYVAANRLKPGDKLPTERDLALTLGVSRPVIREALGTLEALGYIYKKRGKGIFVKEADLSSLFQEMLFLWSNIDNQSDNLLEFRIILEQAAVGQIVDRAGAGELKLDRIAGLIEEAERAPLSKKEFAKHEYNFHRELLSLTGNPMFIQLTDVINKYFQMIATKNMDNDSTVGVAESIQDHRAIVELLKRKDKNGAAGKIRDHLMKPLMAK
ncbi:FadR family transcriptional regulator [Paenibacillus hemerocallicola]|uniref:FadR family transcriptional regulator n=1 Tax=Paenibacillus hemerocallicola TaxID=1172614 RepID=A0A5C4THM2_9BACL|nr:FadR/GntR family transcriptional regulator [Paenibacillus hemerocallicola]TNJ67919.1 FadR family transcriptional regulator [Paenibacillus hemerocallicola]